MIDSWPEQNISPFRNHNIQTVDEQGKLVGNAAWFLRVIETKNDYTTQLFKRKVFVPYENRAEVRNAYGVDRES